MFINITRTFFILSISIYTILITVSSSQSYADDVASQPVNAIPQTRVYIYVGREYMSNITKPYISPFGWYDIAIDGTIIGKIRSGQYMTFSVPAGTHTVTHWLHTFTGDQQPQDFILTAAGNDEVYIQCNWYYGLQQQDAASVGASVGRGKPLASAVERGAIAGALLSMIKDPPGSPRTMGYYMEIRMNGRDDISKLSNSPLRKTIPPNIQP
jgi:hypothetical protein